MNNSNLVFRKIKSLNFLYEVNENGTIFRNSKSKKQLKIKLDYHHSNKGYYMTMVHIGGRRPDNKTVRVMIHRVVAECWLGDCPDGMQVDHIDRNPHNNDYRNLRYVTHSEQMKNRDHSNISKIGSKNLEEARHRRMKPVRLVGLGEDIICESYAEASRHIAVVYNIDAESIRWKFKHGRHRVYDYDVEYLRNVETGHGNSTEYGTVHESDLTGNYTTAFNYGKQKETEDRVKHQKFNC